MLMKNPDLVRTFGRTLAETEALSTEELIEYQQVLLQRLLPNSCPRYDVLLQNTVEF